MSIINVNTFDCEFVGCENNDHNYSFLSVVENLFRTPYRLFNSTSSMYCKDQMHEVNMNRLIRLYCTPTLSDHDIMETQTIVGIQLGLTYVSWANMNTKTHTLLNMDFKMLPQDINKMDVHQIYSVVSEILQRIPQADYYVMEHLPKLITSTGAKNQKVLFIKQRIVARMFHLLVGTEVISSEDIVTKLLSGDTLSLISNLTVHANILLDYKQLSKVEKEILGQAFLLTLAFAELVMYKNENCFKTLLNLKKKS